MKSIPSIVFAYTLLLTSASAAEPPVKAAHPIPPEEWEQFEAELKEIGALNNPRVEDLQKIHDKWFAKWGRLEQMREAGQRKAALRRKYHFTLDPLLDAQTTPDFAVRANAALDPTMEYVNDPTIYDIAGWIFERIVAADDAEITLRLKPSHYAGFKPLKVEFSLRSGAAEMPSPSAKSDVLIPLQYQDLGDNTYRVSFKLTPELRCRLVLQARAVMEPQWVAYGVIKLDQ